MKRRKFIAATGGAIATGMLARPAIVRAADAWPTRDITIIVPLGPGGASDLTSRFIARLASRELNVQVQVKNVIGGAGLTGFAELAASKPDGSVFGIVNVGGLLVFPHIMQVPYTFESYKFLGGVGMIIQCIAAGGDSPFKTIEDVIAVGKTRAITYAASTILNGYCMIQLANLTGAKFRFVATSTNAEAAAAAAGGHVDLVIQTPPDISGLIDSKQLRYLASAIDQRWPAYPDVKTLVQMGYKGAENFAPSGFACPAGVPPELAARLEQIVTKAAREPELIELLEKLSVIPRPMSGQELHDRLQAQRPIVEAALIEAGMKKM